MADFTDTEEWSPIYQLTTADAVKGGALGKSNTQPRQLANRTAWIKTQIDNAITAAGLTPDATVLDQLAIAIQTLALGGKNIGVPYWHMGDTPPVGSMAFTGQLLSRTVYETLWEALNNADNNITVISDADWLAGRTGCWSAGDGSTTFRAPKVLGDFLRVWDSTGLIDDSRVLGSFQDFAVENATGSVGGVRNDNASYEPTGPFAVTASAGNFTNGGALMSWIDFDLSRSINTSTETRPRNTAWMLCFRYQ
ncbi:MAG: hypothetical protein AXW15_05745 [Neptuniibacter sp. Phe_28]|nr:MAG: hypothetical protein AXW15_05745 [Neptuniibacter sp. Phe_28]